MVFNNLILQFGKKQTGNETSVDVTFPIAFIDKITVTTTEDSQSSSLKSYNGVSIWNLSLTGFKAFNWHSNGTSCRVHYIAIGY